MSKGFLFFIKMLYIKIHKSYRDIVAICDSNLIGKKFEEEIKFLEIRESFYKDKEVSEEEAIEIMIDMEKEDATFNIVGENAVKTALKAKIIIKEGISHIQGIPYALALM